MAQVTSGIVGPARQSQESVNYRHHEKCSTCMHFYPMNSCDVVDGNISPDAVCQLWQIKPETKPRDGEFYREEYEKANK